MKTKLMFTLSLCLFCLPVSILAEERLPAQYYHQSRIPLKLDSASTVKLFYHATKNEKAIPAGSFKLSEGQHHLYLIKDGFYSMVIQPKPLFASSAQNVERQKAKLELARMIRKIKSQGDPTWLASAK
jgi:hypothetical protein